MDDSESKVFGSKEEALAYVRTALVARLRADLKSARTARDVAGVLRKFREDWDGKKVQVRVLRPGTKQVELLFDGSWLHWIEDGIRVNQWPAVSGRQGYQSPEHQAAKNLGPLPQGVWIAKQLRYQNIEDTTLSQRWAGRVGLGAWRGGEYAWGSERIWLEPSGGTETRGRSGFSIHGGAEPGSAGCIDLTSYMSDFAAKFLDYGQDVTLIVDYSEAK